ncbi:hypothetical protein SGFS_022550 [Streptomyces graminofaciens]|uniref:Transposase n=1 Tax=Streptomyces graminofaciens TaxID=68212 RepID=A0ABM7F553_9ACTN|nr:hypothetical protein SGFS_022550 [Streptomyces graminofaciens]
MVHRGRAARLDAQGWRGGRNKYFRFTAIDDCTRLLALVEVIQTDSGAESSAFSTGTCSTRAPPPPTSSPAPWG